MNFEFKSADKICCKQSITKTYHDQKLGKSEPVAEKSNIVKTVHVPYHQLEQNSTFKHDCGGEI